MPKPEHNEDGVLVGVVAASANAGDPGTGKHLHTCSGWKSVFPDPGILLSAVSWTVCAIAEKTIWWNRPGPNLDSTIRLEETAQALDSMDRGEVKGKIVIIVSGRSSTSDLISNVSNRTFFIGEIHYY